MQAERHGAARRVASMGLLLALAIALNLAENLLPALPMLPPGVKLGLSNVATIYCLFYLGAGEAVCIAGLKSAFVLITRGVTAGVLSFSGGILSVLVMMAARKLFRKRYAFISIAGAITHNLGQLCAAALILKSAAVFYYLPVLLAAGAVMGFVTAALVKIAVPALGRVSASLHMENNSGKDG